MAPGNSNFVLGFPWIAQQLFEHASWAVAIGTADGTFAAVSPAFASMHGFTASDLVGKPLGIVLPPEQRGELPAGLCEVRERGKGAWPSRHLRADGSTFPVAVEATAIRDEQGRAAYCAVHVQDLTDRARDEKAARDLFEQASDGIFIADLDGRYIDVNTAATRMLGRSREDLLGKRITDLIPPEHAARLSDSRDRLLLGESDMSEWVLQHADGRWIPVEVSATILPDGRWQALVRDISERKRATEALVASETRFRQIVSVAADAIISADEDGKIVLFNEGAERVFGYAASEVLGQPLTFLMPGRFHGIHDAHVEGFVRTGLPARSMADRRPVLARRKNGEEFSAQVSISQVMIHGRRLFTAVARDVTPEVRALEDERFLGEVSATLAASLDVEVTLDRLSDLVVGYLADVCVVEFTQAGGARTVRTGVRTPGREGVLAAASRYAQETGGTRLGAGVFESGAPELVAEVTTQHLARYAGAPACLDLVQAAAPRSILSVPMRARGELRGVLTLLSGARTYDHRDMRLASDVGSRAAAALDNASLHDALTRAHADLRQRVAELQEAQEKIRALTGLLPVCAWCGLIRDDEKGGAWTRFEQYVQDHSSAEVTHGICPTCIDKFGMRRK